MTNITKIDKNRYDVNVDGRTVRLVRKDDNDRAFQSLAYDAIDAFAEQYILDALDENVHTPITREQENTEFGKQHLREYTKLKKAAIAQAKPKLNNLLASLNEIDRVSVIGEADLRFSSKAGCSCGCSPAFRLGARVYLDSVGLMDVFVRTN